MAKVKRVVREIDAQAYETFRNTTSSDRAVAEKARQEYAQALQEPLRQAILAGQIYNEIFTIEKYPMNVKPMYMLDWITPGTEGDYVGYNIPAQGELPRKIVNADYIEVPCYDIGASLDWNRRFAQVAGPQFLRKANERLESMLTKKLNDDCFHALLMAALDRGIVVYDAAAAANQFTKRLVSIAQLVMKRNAGGNSVTNNRMLTDIFMSLEAFEDIRNWQIDIIPDAVRERVFNNASGLSDIFGTNLHPIFEFGVGQEYQNYWTTDLAASMPSGDSEIMLGFDLSVDDAFVMPVQEEVEVLYDEVRRQRLQGIWATMCFGVAVLDSRRLLALSC